MPRFNSADDAAIWGEGDWDNVAAPLPPSEKNEAPPSSKIDPPPVLASLTKLQVLIETLRETQLDAVQQELAVFLAETAVLMRCEILGEEPPPPEHRPSLFDELDIEEIELIDDQGQQLQTSPATQDYLDFEFEDDLCDAPDPLAALAEYESQSAPSDFLDDIDIIENEDAAHSAAPVYTSQADAANSGPLAQLRFLVADDNPAQLVAARTLLESLGADCHACNCTMAAQLARMGGWDAILIDIHMHARDSIAALRQIRSDEANGRQARTPVFVMAGAMNPDQMRECQAEGADGHVAKPLSAAAIMDQFEVLSLERSLRSPD